MGVTVRQKTKGRGEPWWVFIAHNGKRKSLKVGDKAAAEALASELRQKLKGGSFNIAPAPKTLTFGEYARKWIDRSIHLKHSTLINYEVILKHHVTPLIDKPLDQVARMDIKELIAERQKAGKSPKTVRNIKAFISSVLSNAFEDEIITGNPSVKLGKFIKTKERKADINPFTREEAQLFLSVVSDHCPRYYPFFLCALRTGMRLGELRGLKWEDIDFNGNFIEIRRSYTKGEFTTPKNHKSRRVDMSNQLARALKELRTESKKEALAKGWREVPELVFVDSSGKIIDDANMRNRIFNKVLEKAGLRRIRLHDLRHTFASLLIQQGESLAYVKDQLGHHSIQITVDTYGHLVPGANREAVNRLDDDILDLSEGAYRVHGGVL